MRRNRSRVFARRVDQLAAAQEIERGLDSAFREAGGFGEGAQTGGDWFPFLAGGQAEKIKVNKIGGRLAIVADDVAHQDVEDVIVDGNGLAEARHGRIWKPGDQELIL